MKISGILCFFSSKIQPLLRRNMNQCATITCNKDEFWWIPFTNLRSGKARHGSFYIRMQSFQNRLLETAHLSCIRKKVPILSYWSQLRWAVSRALFFWWDSHFMNVDRSSKSSQQSLWLLRFINSKNSTPGPPNLGFGAPSPAHDLGLAWSQWSILIKSCFNMFNHV